MHMADSLISPAVGGVMLATAAGITVYSVKKVHRELDQSKIPLMGVMGAFVFAIQMINFSIPLTGSSGHLGGGILLSILLGPYAGFLTISCVLLIQALFFNDGGLLAFGCNLFNLGFFTCFISYPLIFKWINYNKITKNKIFISCIISAIVSLQLGSFSVVIETFLSGKTELPFGTFIMFMQPIHLAIGIIEGLVTSAIVVFLWKARPEIIERWITEKSFANISFKKVLIVFIISTFVVGGWISLFSSSNPDGLEWSINNTAGITKLEASSKIHKLLSEISNKISLLPDYNFRTSNNSEDNKDLISKENVVLSSSNIGTSMSGIIGGLLTLMLAVFTGFTISKIKKNRQAIG